MQGRPRVLVTDAEIRKSLAVVRGLGSDFEVITASSQRPALAAWSRYSDLHLRSAPAPEFSSWLVEAVQEHSIQILICPQEQTLCLACAVYDDLEAAGVHLSFPPLATLDKAFDKARTLRLAAEAGIPAPETIVLETCDEAPEAAEKLGYPVVIKSRYSNFQDGQDWVAGAGSDYARTPVELADALRRLDDRLPPPLLQSYVPGSGTAVFVVLDRQGRLGGRFAHRRVRDVRPTGSGSTLRESIAVDEELLETSLTLLEKMGWWGIAMVEFRRDERSGEALLMEVNGRFWGSLQLATDAGVNFPRLLAQVSLGESPQPGEYLEGIAVRWWLGDLLGTLRVLKGRPANYPGEFPGRWSAIREFLGPQSRNTRNEVVRPDDPWPGFAEVLSAVGRLR